MTNTKQWIELQLDATAEGVDWVRSLLATIEFGGEVDITPIAPDLQDEREPWQFTVRIYGLERTSASHHRLEVDRIANLLQPLQRTDLTTNLRSSVVSEFPALPAALSTRIGRFAIQPPGCLLTSEPPADEIVLQLGSTLAFGSGLHPTTIVSLKLLQRHLTADMHALDLGSGSGILSVAMAKLGAQVLAIDNDPIAIAATQSAVQLNQVESQVRVCIGSLGQGSELGHWMNRAAVSSSISLNPTAEFDLIVANVLSRVHGVLAADYFRALKPQAVLTTAGYIIDRADEVDAALSEAGLVQIDREEFGEWVAIAHQVR